MPDAPPATPSAAARAVSATVKILVWIVYAVFLGLIALYNTFGGHPFRVLLAFLLALLILIPAYLQRARLAGARGDDAVAESREFYETRPQPRDWGEIGVVADALVAAHADQALVRAGTGGGHALGACGPMLCAEFGLRIYDRWVPLFSVRDVKALSLDRSRPVLYENMYIGSQRTPAGQHTAQLEIDGRAEAVAVPFDWILQYRNPSGQWEDAARRGRRQGDIHRDVREGRRLAMQDRKENYRFRASLTADDFSDFLAMVKAQADLVRRTYRTPDVLTAALDREVYELESRLTGLVLEAFPAGPPSDVAEPTGGTGR